MEKNSAAEWDGLGWTVSRYADVPRDASGRMLVGEPDPSFGEDRAAAWDARCEEELAARETCWCGAALSPAGNCSNVNTFGNHRKL